MTQQHILVVDDNPINLKLISATLKFAGYQISGASDAESAQALLKLQSFDLILMDIALPGMDGLTLTRLLKADSQTRHIPIIALTASAMKGDETKALAAGCDRYITKPIDTRSLPRAIAEFLPGATQTLSPIGSGAH
jgi:CheY-like chemotaxis protein